MEKPIVGRLTLTTVTQGLSQACPPTMTYGQVNVSVKGLLLFQEKVHATLIG